MQLCTASSNLPISQVTCNRRFIPLALRGNIYPDEMRRSFKQSSVLYVTSLTVGVKKDPNLQTFRTVWHITQKLLGAETGLTKVRLPHRPDRSQDAVRAPGDRVRTSALGTPHDREGDAQRTFMRARTFIVAIRLVQSG